MSVSILILTLNEERNLAACLESVKWSDDIVVLDSFSTDRTIEIAQAFGARVIQRKFDDYASRQNWAASEISFKNPWVYNSDADEVVPPELRDELLAIAADDTLKPVAYRLRHKNFFCGRWIRHCGIYPVWNLRFFKPGKVRFERSVHSVALVDGEEGRLKNHYLHFSFNNGLDAWFDKHNRYSFLEAVESLRSLRASRLNWRELKGDAVARRRLLKEISIRLPCRPILRFTYMYLLRLGFLDGWQGYTYCRLLTIYEYMIVVKVMELERRERGLSV
jgi:glycosyltransferase involved in cell wall biosynthesis